MKKILIIILVILFSINSISFANPNGAAMAWDDANGLWRVIQMTSEGLIVASSSAAIAAAPNFLAMSTPQGALCGYYATGDKWVPLMCDSSGNLMISGGGSSSTTFVTLTDTPADYTGQAGKIPAVNIGETGLEFVANAAGSTTYLGLTDTPSAYTGQAGKVATVNAGETALEFTTPSGAVDSVNGDTGTVVLTADDIDADVLGTPTYTTLQDNIDQHYTTGYFEGGAFTDNGDGSLSVASGSGNIRATNDNNANVLSFDFPANASVSCTNNDTTYVYVSYNAGTPVVTSSTTKPTDVNTNILLGKVFREGTDLHLFKNGMNNNNAIRSIRGRFTAGGEVELMSGGLIGETGERYITVSASVLYAGFNKVTTSAIDTSTPTNYELYYSDGGTGFTEVAATQINNTNYDDGDGTLGTLSSDRYRTDWLYLSNDGELLVRLGTGNYKKISDANAETPPTSLPKHITDFSSLIGKVIVREGETNLIEVRSAVNDNISFTGIINHNETSGLQGGTADEYYHLTSAQATVVSNTSNTNTGDETDVTIKTKLGAASTSHDGYLTQTNWDTFNDKADNPMTTQGDIIYGGASGVETRLAKGTASQVLTMNSGATAPEWSDAASGLPTGQTGEIIYHNGTSWVVLAAGTADYVLQANGSAAPSWVEASSGGSSMWEEIEFPAGCFDYPNGTSFEIAPLDYYDGAPDRIYFQAFDDSEPEYLMVSHTFKTGFDDGTAVQFIWEGFSESVTTGDVVFDIAYSKYNSSTTLTPTTTVSVTGSAQTVPGTAQYKHVFTVSQTLTGWVAGDTIRIKINRDPDDSNDDFAADWNLLFFRIKYKRSL